MRLLLLVCVQTILMASGNCLMCEDCYNSISSKGPITCSGISHQCGRNQVCLTLHTRKLNIRKNEFSNYFTYSIRRKCWDFKACDHRGKMSSPTHKISFSTDCCYQDNCMTPFPEFPPENNIHNGLVCPASSLEDNNTPTKAMKCTTDEEYCFEFISDQTEKQYAAGCASYRSCYLKSLIAEFYGNQPQFSYVQKSCETANATSFLPVVNYLLCWQCHGSLDLKCEQSVMCSTENDACVTIISKTTYGQRTHIQLFKRCGFSTECNRAGTITSTQKKISKNTTCCYTNNCISPKPTLPSENDETNGHICESCYLKEYGSCSGKDRIACTGNATRCISYTERVIDGNFNNREVLHGCTHPSLCDNEHIRVTYDDKIIQETKLCRIPSKSSQHLPNILCAIVLFMMLLKLM